MLKNIHLWIEVCKSLNIPYESLHETQNLLKINLAQPVYFVNWITPFNDHAISNIFKDKEYTYCALKDLIKTPKTKGFLSPICREKYKHYLVFDTYEKIVNEIIHDFELPLIIKRNRGFGGSHVYRCDSFESMIDALDKIYSKQEAGDYLALAQEYVEIKHEYRAIIYQNRVRLLYTKSVKDAVFIGNLSPLHWEGSRATMIADPEKIAEIQSFLKPVFQAFPNCYAGVDVAEDEAGNYCLIELNGDPGFEIFVRDNGQAAAVEVLKEILLDWMALNQINLLV